MGELAGLWSKLQIAAGVLMAGLVGMVALCAWQRQATQQQGDAALARAWADALRSFGGMLVAACLLGVAGWWLIGVAIDLLASYGSRP